MDRQQQGDWYFNFVQGDGGGGAHFLIFLASVGDSSTPLASVMIGFDLPVRPVASFLFLLPLGVASSAISPGCQHTTMVDVQCCDA
jgi:hypothetical protein